MAKPMKTLELYYPMIQFLINFNTTAIHQNITSKVCKTTNLFQNIDHFINWFYMTVNSVLKSFPCILLLYLLFQGWLCYHVQKFYQPHGNLQMMPQNLQTLLHNLILLSKCTHTRENCYQLCQQHHKLRVIKSHAIVQLLEPGHQEEN